MRIPMGELLNPGAIQGDRLSMNAPDMSPIARGIQQIGNAVGGLAEKWQADQKKMDTYNANLALERWSNDAAVNYEQNLKGSAPDGAGFMETQQKYLQDSFMKVRNTIKDPELQAKADIIFEQTKGRHQLTGMKDVEKKQTSYVLSTTGDSIKSTIETGQIGTREQYTDYFDNVVKPRIDSVIDDPLERKKAYALFGQQMAGEYFRLNPGEAAPKIASGGRQPVVVANQPGRVSKGSIDGVNPALVERFRKVQDAFGQSIPIVSGYRDAATNAKAGGANKSQHLSGNAIDLDVSNLSREQRVAIIETASNAGITGIGVYANSLHFDLGGRRAWGPSHHANSVPPWAAGAVQRHMAGKARSMEGGAGGLWNRLIATESGGNQSAVSPKGAVGRAQIMPSTGPEAARLAGLPWDEQRLRADPQYNEALGKAYLNEQLRVFGGDNAKALAAYNAGPGAVKNAMARGGKNWLAQMPRETQAYVQKIMGGGDVAAVTYAPPEMPRGGPFDYIQPDDWDRMTKAGQSAFKDSLRLGIETGQVSIGDILSAPVDDGDKATLLSRYREVNKELDGLASFSERLASGGFINPRSGDDRKAAGRWLDGAGGAQAIVDGDPQAVQSMYDLYDKTGIVPDNAKGAINGMLRAKDGARVMTALQFLDAFDRRNHPAFNQEFDAETSAMLQDYRSGLDYDTPQQKVERIQQSIDPANATVRKERRKEAEKVSDKFDIGDVGNVFDPSYMPMTEPGFGLLPDQQSQLLADYRSEYNKAFEASGDDGAARQVANDRIRSVWGASEANGGRVMKWPPEILYGSSAAVNGSFDWMREDVEKGLMVRGYVQSVEFPVFDAMGNQTGATETVSQIVPYFLVADEQTVREYQAGKSPSYLVAIIDAEGRYDFPSLGGGYEQTPSRFSFDPASARDRYNRQFRADHKTNQQDAIGQEQDMQELFKPSGNALWPQ